MQPDGSWLVVHEQYVKGGPNQVADIAAAKYAVAGLGIGIGSKITLGSNPIPIPNPNPGP
eukprot:scaffold31980_cov28-Phaeocystis_antarctica.AAC.1